MMQKISIISGIRKITTSTHVSISIIIAFNIQHRNLNLISDISKAKVPPKITFWQFFFPEI